MGLLHVSPQIDQSTDQIRGSTPFVAQFLLLFAYCRTVTVDRAKQQVVVTTRWLWFWSVRRSVPFDRVSRIIYRAQELPSLSPIRYLTALQGSDLFDSAFFLISIAVKSSADDRRARDELTLFSVWQQQPRASDWLDKFAGVRVDPYQVGDERAGAIVNLLRDYLGVPIASH
jgi:hypothetical protein